MKATAAATASAMALCSCGTSSAFTTHTSFSRVSAPRNAVGRASAKGMLRPRTLNMAVAIPRAVSVEAAPPATIDMEGVQLSGLNGLALKPKTFPTKREVMDVIPKHCFVKDTVRSMKYAVLSCAITLSMGGLAAAFLPLKLAMLPAWIAYAVACGTAATGAWVVAHECGHGAFSDNRKLQDAVGYVLHSALLVPYFSWQRSHAVHHAHTNHMEKGETHVPEMVSHKGFGLQKQRKLFRTVLGKKLGTVAYGVTQMFNHLVVGWPAYLLFGATGGPSRGITSHFFPHPPFSTGEKGTDLYPGKWKKKVWLSDVGVAGMIAGLVAWASKAGAMQVAALYGGPLMVVNAWLVLITWLQHTDVDVPHFEADNWNFIKGALHTVDRPYGKVLDFLHHRIGSTHVAHHVDCTIPHYHALEATNAIKEAFPEHYLYDPTPLPQATWRLATQCAGVEKRGDMHVFVTKE
ncbi:unnamed protein product [Ectocarpus sp. CCAP 1310/34]|nr:unnamed protein product [Ectocarpus sp. CCAP 1310/34]